MANDYSSQPLTGKSKRKQVQPVSEELMLPVLKKEEVSKKAMLLMMPPNQVNRKGPWCALKWKMVY